MLRSYVAEAERGARFAAVFGIIGFIDVPIVYMSIRWWRTLHPSPVIGGGEGSGLAPQMVLSLVICLVAFTLLYTVLLIINYRTKSIEYELAILKDN